MLGAKGIMVKAYVGNADTGRNTYTKGMAEGTCLSRMMGILKWELEIGRMRTGQ